MPFEPWKEEEPSDGVQPQEEAPPPEPVAKAEPEPAPEPAPEVKAPEPVAERRTDEAIPLAKALEWRNQWRSTEAKLQEAMERLRALEQPKAPEPQVPRYEDDPIEHLRAKTELTEAQLRDMRERAAAEESQRQAIAQRQQFVGWYQQEAQKFAAQQADFGEAYKHTVTRMGDILRNASDNPQEVSQALEAWEAGIVRRAAAEGRNPAAAIYEVARALGYAPPAPPAPAAPTEMEKVTNIAEAKERSKSLGPSRSAEKDGEAEDDEFGGLKTLFEAQAEMGMRRKK